jgi:hypothetical protein
MGNESTPIDVSYYPLTFQGSGTNDNIIIGLLVGLLVGVTTLVLLTGAILVSVILKNAKRQNDTNACNLEDPLAKKGGGNTDHSIDRPQRKTQNVQDPMPVQWMPNNVHPLQIQGLNGNSTNKVTGPREVPRDLTPGRWAPTEAESRLPPSHVDTWQYGPKDRDEGFAVR